MRHMRSYICFNRHYTYINVLYLHYPYIIDIFSQENARYEHNGQFLQQLNVIKRPESFYKRLLHINYYF